MEQLEQVQLTASHWVFLLVILAIFVSIGFRKGVIIPSIAGIFMLGLLAEAPHDGALNQLIFAVQVVFRALLNAGIELFDIMLVIALMVAMLKSLQSQGADRLMVAPMKKLMIGPWTAFFVLGVTMYIAAAFFWPTPAVALVGTVLIPVAMQVGLPAIGAAMAVNLFGHGMALSADPVIQGASRLTASAAGIETSALLPYTLLFSITVGVVAITIACLNLRRDMRSGVLQAPQTDEVFTPQSVGAAAVEADTISKTPEPEPAPGPYARFFAVAVPVILIGVAVLMIYRALFVPDQAIQGGGATALLGGTATVLLVLSSFAAHGHHALDGISSYTREGFFFAIKIFAPIIPIAGFFFLGHPEHSAQVIGSGSAGYLFDIGNNIGRYIDGNVFLLTFGMAFIGLLTGMDGSGFSGLPLVGSLSGALGTGAGVDVHVLAALGQVAAIFAGGGTLAAWAFGVAADAGIAGVSPAALVRRNFVPVISGIVVACGLAIILMI
ncbi:hypothetical protein [Billgrantia endophytica]|uniref:Citrate transporter n=1 Tax=Billgrantia endophytica TaxID=2033802 RepID=A0A2N7U6S8_9GAMM|nr:hypothetical protein [Halomonas endophytica]PMR76121.1 hypothetical protein C1H69_07015 [Halomonas endophytica]